MEKQSILNKLNQTVLHDQQLDSIVIDTNPVNSIIFNCRIYNEETKKYDSFIVKCDEIIDLNMSSLKLTQDLDFEINTFDYTWEKNFKLNAFMLTGHGEPGLSIKLECKKVVLS